MVGVICKWDIVAHPWVTVHCFGWKVFLRALTARRDETFLSLAAGTPAASQPAETATELVRRCVALELRAKRVYEVLARAFAGRQPLRELFETLARQEQDHAELLGLCREAAGRDRWKRKALEPLPGALPELEKLMEDAESSSVAVESPAGALRLALRIESSEVNEVFARIVAAADSEFVRRLGAFRTAVRDHVGYLCRRAADLEPGLAEECRELAARFAPAAVKPR